MKTIRLGAVINTTARPGRTLLLDIERCVQERMLAHRNIILRTFQGSAATTVENLSKFASFDLDALIFSGIQRDTVYKFLEQNPKHPPLVLAKYTNVPETEWDMLGDTAVVVFDNDSIGRRAADFFVEHGLRNFAFLYRVGYREDICGEVRSNAFKNRLAETIGDKFTYKELAFGTFAENEDCWDDDDEKVAAWIDSLPTPCGLFVNGDRLAFKIAEHCARRDLDIPGRIELLGVDNGEGYCEKSNPEISCVVPGFGDFASKAVEFALDLATNGAREQERLVDNISECRIDERGTTALSRGYGHVAARAQDYIHANACSGISVPDVAYALGVSRRTLEIRVREATGKSVHTIIRDVKLDKVCHLLRDTDLPISEVILRSGYALTTNAFVLFKKQYGMTMKAFRRLYRPGRR